MPGCLYVRVGGNWVPVASTVAAQWSDAYPTYDLRYANITAPKGRVGYAEVITTLTIATTMTALPGLSVTVNNMDATRRYVVRAKLPAQSTVTADVVRYVITADGGQIDLAQGALSPAASFCGPFILEKAYNAGGISGSHTYSVSGQRFAGTGTVTAVGQAGIPMFIEVQDNGAA